MIADLEESKWSYESKVNDLLARFAAGQLPLALHALVSAHLMISGRNRGFVSDLEGLRAQAFEKVPPCALSQRDKMLDAILAQTSAPVAKPSVCQLPEPLVRLIGKDLSEINWRRTLPGIRDFHFDADEGVETTLYYIKAGSRVPAHTHEGSEVTLVLQGAFVDQTGRYGLGDLAFGDAEIDHQPMVTRDGDCLCFAVIDAPLRFTGPIGRHLNRFVRN